MSYDFGTDVTLIFLSRFASLPVFAFDVSIFSSQNLCSQLDGLGVYVHNEISMIVVDFFLESFAMCYPMFTLSSDPLTSSTLSS